MNHGRIVGVCFLVMGAAISAPPAPGGFEATVQPLLSKNCYACHNEKVKSGELNLRAYTNSGAVTKSREEWEKILRRLETGDMPPKGMPRPEPSELKGALSWIQGEFDRADRSMKPEPGRVTTRRLNRSEYNNTIRDLLGVNTHPADEFPPDDSGYGFDSIGDVLSLSPVLMEKYLAAAEKIVHTAIYGTGDVKPTVVRHQPPYRPGTDGGDNSRFASTVPYTTTDYDVTGLAMPSALHATHRFPATGEYIFRIDPEGNRPQPSDDFKVAVWIDGKQAATVTYEASNSATSLEGVDRTVTIKVPAGEHWVAISALRVFEGLPAKYGGLKPNTQPAPPPQVFRLQEPKPDATKEELADFEERRKNLTARQRQRANKPPLITDVSFRVNFVEITGPFKPETKPSTESLKKVFTCGHPEGRHAASCPRTIFADLIRRAYRRPATPVELNRVLALVDADRKRGSSFEDAVGVGLTALLVNPQFLFRIERDPLQAGRHRINDFELASRLSYFLWSSMPDEELLRQAGQGALSKPQTLESQVRRMLKDPKSAALVEDFGGQWLEFRGLESKRPDLNQFGRFSDYLRMSMRQETEMFFQDIIREDRSLLEFLGASYTFLNEELAQFYGIKGVSGPQFRKVDLHGTQRRGVLTHGSVLTVSSYSNRTSTVLRGKWVLDNLLNAPVPAPPADVPTLDETTVGTSLTLRQQMEKHRTNVVCASCHSRMDPLGFGLENFDAIGRWRTVEGKLPIDASGVMPDGKTFSGPLALIDMLSEKREDFSRAITEKMLTYALGRGLEGYDRPALRTITSSLAKENYRMSSLVLGIVRSLPFQERRGDRIQNVSHP